MFSPKYTITDVLLANIKRINTLINDLNNQRFPNVVLLELERVAREISAHASTSIEGNPLPLTEVKMILKAKPAHIRDSEREVLNYNRALQDLDKDLKNGKTRLSVNLILRIQQQVTDDLLLPFESGHLRQKPIVVNDPKTRQVRFLPPDAKDVKPLMEEVIEFVNKNEPSSPTDRGKIDPLILAGLFHKQMVLIHPFMDGNGRTARLATKVLLAEMGLDTFNLFSFENYYNQNVTRYFQKVGETGNYYDLVSWGIDFTPWLEYFTEGIIDELLRVQKLLPKVSTSPKTELQSQDLKLLSFLRERGFVADREYAKFTDRAKATRTKDFNRLIELGLIERKGKGRATYYVLREA